MFKLNWTSSIAILLMVMMVFLAPGVFNAIAAINLPSQTDLAAATSCEAPVRINFNPRSNVSNLKSTSNSLKQELLAAPVAVDDIGPGFITTEDNSFTTGYVLANDSDPDGDPLFVENFYHSGTTGLVSKVDGTLDASFGNNGKVITSLGSYDSAHGIVIQPDGKLVVAGRIGFNFGVARYNPNGTLDTSFDGDGMAVTEMGGDNWANALALQNDGKIVVAGFTAGGAIAVARYNSNGSLDTSFDLDGKLYNDIFPSTASAVAIQSDGKIVVAGSAYNSSNNYTYDFILIRYNPDGSLDTSFDSDGVLTTTITEGDDMAYAMVIQNDGKIIVAGTVGGAYGWQPGDLAVIRYNSDGSPDTSFDNDGAVVTDFGSTDAANAVIVQHDGKIVVAGETGGDIAVARYNSNGSLDTSFDSDGMLTTSITDGDDFAQALALQPDDKILVAGAASKSTYISDFAVIRYNPDGSLDSEFDSDGILTTRFTGGDDLGYAMVIQSDGKVVVAGHADWDIALARYLPYGVFTYDPNGQFDWLLPGEQAYDTFSYAISDGVLTDTATVTITINGITRMVYIPMITSPCRPVTPANPMQNSDFEAGRVEWTEYVSGILPWDIIRNDSAQRGVPPHSGNWVAWIWTGWDPDINKNVSGYIEQTLTIPNCTPYLSFWYWARGADNWCPPRCMAASVRVNGETVQTISLQGNSTQWSRIVVDLSDYAGQTVTLQFEVGGNAYSQPAIIIDDLGFQWSLSP